MALAFNPTAYADGHGNEATSDGAFTTLMVQAEDVGAYIKALEASDNVFEATGTVAVAVWAVERIVGQLVHADRAGIVTVGLRH